MPLLFRVYSEQSEVLNIHIHMYVLQNGGCDCGGLVQGIKSVFPELYCNNDNI